MASSFLKFEFVDNKDFHEFWDESYDMTHSDQERIEQISEIIKYICSHDERQLCKLFNDMRPILEHNYNTLKNYEQWSKLN